MSDTETVNPTPAEDVATKRKQEEPEVDSAPLVKKKKARVMPYEHMYLDKMPCTNHYEKSYMHRDTITHISCTKTDFLITASCDGHIKFWKKQELGIEFVKHFRAHLGPVTCMSTSYNGELMSTVSVDKALKVFDIVNFDMINMINLGFTPSVSEWIYSPGSRIATVAVAERDSSKIYVYDGRGGSEAMHVIEGIHTDVVICMCYNSVYKIGVSADKKGMLEYWGGQEHDFVFPKGVVNFKFKTDTDLYELIKCNTYAMTIAFSPDGKLMACTSMDRHVRVFHFLSGKKSRVFKETLDVVVELQQTKSLLPNMEFGRRLAAERELEKSLDNFALCNCIFDESGQFLLYATMLGVKVINLTTNRCVRFIGKPENIRFLNISMFQGFGAKTKATLTADMQASNNPGLQETILDPTLFATGFKKNRFYLFSRRDPDDAVNANTDRDIFNERPTKEEVMSATQTQNERKTSETAVMHTAMGDIHLKLFATECPKTTENFCVHSRNGYYNGHIFHRIIKGFMIQTGDPLGTGTGGESIWGGEFEDEFHPNLRHDRPYTLSMANAGPNTNGSQFFITVVPTPWLDNKHTVFGRVTKGMEVVHSIATTKVHPKTDKPYDDITIISISIK